MIALGEEEPIRRLSPTTREGDVKRLARRQIWQGWRDSNPRMQESKSCALPLGDIPILLYAALTPPKLMASVRGVGKGTRTLDTRNHNPVL